ncbi:unnamed protein product [Didymodactylos carnosus]|uniref:ABC transporter domain-containing protein n=1 Tax=Didymodactylos carnosus TaxID=1234261 RepID=A0A813V481_9BILA|nr:unnamed protein product [Didymodactylos carnosus]CAF3619143.1 unnamed protein product [Didymodactylos carnosus]
MTLQPVPDSATNAFWNYQVNKDLHNNIGDYLRQQRPLWRDKHYPITQRNLEWYEYLRRQAGLQGRHNVPYGKHPNTRRRRRQQLKIDEQGDINQNYYGIDDDKGISKIDYISLPVTLTWLDLKAEVPPKESGLTQWVKQTYCPWREVQQPKQLLKGVSGIVKPGQLVAIMGASGAGKTTLMNILTSRRPGNLKISGDVRVNGSEMGRNISRVAGYVQQEELFIPTMTAREHLTFQVLSDPPLLLYLLAEGRVAYFGPLAKAKEFFGRLGFTPPEKFNPTDFYIQTLAILPYDRETCLKRVEFICDEYEYSPMYSQQVAEAQQFHVIQDDQATFGLFRRSSKYKTGFFTQLRWLLWRSFKNISKNPFEARLQLILSVSYAREYPVLFKEHDDNIYQIFPYYISRFLVELPVYALTAFITGTIHLFQHQQPIAQVFVFAKQE